MKKKNLSWRHVVVANMSLELLLFLTEKNLLTRFLDNTVEDSIFLEIERDFHEYFTWSHTKEGWAFWNEWYHEYLTQYLPKYHRKRQKR